MFVNAPALKCKIFASFVPNIGGGNRVSACMSCCNSSMPTDKVNHAICCRDHVCLLKLIKACIYVAVWNQKAWEELFLISLIKSFSDPLDGSVYMEQSLPVVEQVDPDIWRSTELQPPCIPSSACVLPLMLRFLSVDNRLPLYLHADKLLCQTDEYRVNSATKPECCVTSTLSQKAAPANSYK